MEEQYLEQCKLFADTSVPYFSLNGICNYARLVDVYDGDTITCILNVYGGFYKFHIRISGIDTPEIKSKNESEKAKAFEARQTVLKYLCPQWTHPNAMCHRNEIQDFLRDNIVIVWVECLEFDKYGRLLAKIFPNKNCEKSVSDLLLERGMAYSYDGGTKNNNQG